VRRDRTRPWLFRKGKKPLINGCFWFLGFVGENFFKSDYGFLVLVQLHVQTKFGCPSILNSIMQSVWCPVEHHPHLVIGVVVPFLGMVVLRSVVC